MLKISDKSKVFVLCPPNLVTGGTELLHQLVSLLNNNGRSTYIFYRGEAGVEYSVPEAFSGYNIQVASGIENGQYNIIVVPEVTMDTDELLRKYDKIQMVFWWLSIDNYMVAHRFDAKWSDLYHWNKVKAFKVLYKRIMRIFSHGQFNILGRFSIKSNLGNERIVHAYQCEYAQYLLQKLDIRVMVALKDYIHTSYMEQGLGLDGKKDVVLFNPVKGFKVTKRLIAAAPDIEWLPIINMNRQQVANAMRTSKVYIDFGNHPGKDRLPRECAANGCCIITGREGAAAFFEDVAIDNCYKFDAPKRDMAKIIASINDIFANYTYHASQFDYYRRRIMEEKAEFEQQAAQLFGL